MLLIGILTQLLADIKNLVEIKELQYKTTQKNYKMCRLFKIVCKNLFLTLEFFVLQNYRNIILCYYPKCFIKDIIFLIYNYLNF